MTAATKERPILMSAPMVRAILDGRKTQTRRVAKLTQGPSHGYAGQVKLRSPYAANLRDGIGPVWTPHAGAAEQPMPPEKVAELCPYGSPGDRLWVREKMERRDGVAWYYAADGHEVRVRRADETQMITWTHHKMAESCSPIHMPRFASRITLEITGVRVERLRSISEVDKLAEGATPVMTFGTFWRLINSKPGTRWEDDPWVWAIAFKRLEGPGRA